MTGALGMMAAAGGPAFTPLLRVYAGGTGATETAPAGASSVTIELWGGGGGGRKGTVAPVIGNGGGSGGNVRSTYGIAGGQTLTYTIGTGGKGQDATAAAAGIGSSVSSGTATITTMSAGGGGQGGTSTRGTGGTATGGTDANVVGNVGTADPDYFSSPAPFGIRANTDGLTYGAGGKGGIDNTQNGFTGIDGGVAFYYT